MDPSNQHDFSPETHGRQIGITHDKCKQKNTHLHTNYNTRMLSLSTEDFTEPGVDSFASYSIYNHFFSRTEIFFQHNILERKHKFQSTSYEKSNTFVCIARLSPETRRHRYTWS